MDMNYVFFDIECANCLHGEGKICSFGFVKTDMNFNIIKKKDILINPDAKFLLGNVKTGEGIKLAYPLFKFNYAYLFPRYYKEIKCLLEDEENICIGFAVKQDVSYITYTCQRYQLPFIKFKYFDVQKFEKILNSRKDLSGLDSLIYEYNLKKFTYHRSDDDAYMTMEVFKALLEQNKLNIQDVIDNYQNCFSDTDTFIKERDYKLKLKSQREIHQNKMKSFFTPLDIKYDINLVDQKYFKKNIFFENQIYVDDIDFLLKHKEIFYLKGINVVSKVKDADIIVILNKKPPFAELKENVVFVKYSKFKEVIK